MRNIILSGILLNGILSIPYSNAAQIGKAGSNTPLNVVLITADDLNYSSVGYMGCRVSDVTPNLDKLASQSLVFHNAFVNIAVSQPSRAVLATGLYSHKNGVDGFFHTEKAIPTVMSVLKEAGYAVGIAGKLDHSTPVTSFKWDMEVDQPNLGEGRDPKRYYEVFKGFVEKAKEENKPFYFMVNSHDPHAPFHGSEWEHRVYPNKNFPDASRVYTADEMTVPDFLPDLPETREELAQYYSSVRRLDDVVGEIIRVINEQEIEGNTMIMFLSDNGMDFPFAKTNCYLNSNKTPWIVKWPGVTKEGTVDSINYVSAIDFMPTILEACHIPQMVVTDGKSFVPLLKGKKQKGREKVFTQFYETSAKNRYPMFAVHDANFCYIFNPWVDGSTVFKNCSWAGMTFKAMVKNMQSDKPVEERLKFFKYRTSEELYDIKKDPDGLNNLMKDEAYKQIINEYRLCLEDWMRKHGSSALDVMKNRNEGDSHTKFMKEQEKLVRNKNTHIKTSNHE